MPSAGVLGEEGLTIQSHHATHEADDAKSISAIEMGCIGRDTVLDPPKTLPVSATAEVAENADKLKGLRFALLFTALLLANFAIGYDSSCIATLTPVITDQFHALQDLGWYTISYLLASSATMLVYGQLYSFFSMKWLFISSLVVFAAGSVLTAAAPTSPAFIVGRALNGLGSAGAFSGTTIILAHTTSLQYRPIYLAVAGGVETAALAFGPLISGAIADRRTWRLAFWINVPIVVSIIVLTLFSIKSLRRSEHAQPSGKKALGRIDWTGFGINIPMTLCLVMALQWGGTVYTWSSWRVVLLLVLAGLLLISFLAVEHHKAANSMVPLNMMRQRSVLFASLITFCDYAHLSLVAYYLPIYFQAIRGASTIASGVMYLPTAVALGVAALIGGPLITKIGYYSPVLLTGSIIAAIGSGLITTFGVHMSPANWITYQVVYGIGIGLSFQPPYIAVQTVLDENVVPMALVMLSYTQQIGGIIMLSIAQNVFLARLKHNIVTTVPGLDPDIILRSGALGLVDSVPPTERAGVLIAYNDALTQVLYIALGLTCLVVVSAMGVEWRSVKKEKVK